MSYLCYLFRKKLSLILFIIEHPKSVKDNLLGAEYLSYYSELPKNETLTAKEKEVVGYGDKQNLIQSLEENRRR